MNFIDVIDNDDFILPYKGNVSLMDRINNLKPFFGGSSNKTTRNNNTDFKETIYKKQHVKVFEGKKNMEYFE